MQNLIEPSFFLTRTTGLVHRHFDGSMTPFSVTGHFLAGGKWHPMCRVTLRFGVTSIYLHLDTVSFTMLTFSPTGMNCDESVQTASILPWHINAFILAKNLFSGTHSNLCCYTDMCHRNVLSIFFRLRVTSWLHNSYFSGSETQNLCFNF